MRDDIICIMEAIQIKYMLKNLQGVVCGDRTRESGEISLLFTQKGLKQLALGKENSEAATASEQLVLMTGRLDR